MKQPLLTQEDKRSWRLLTLVGALFGLALFGCFVAQNYETQREIAIGWLEPSLRSPHAGRPAATTWPILRVEKANMDPYRLWDLMGQGLTFSADELETATEKQWLHLVHSRDPRADFRRYQFAMMDCAVDEVRAESADETILEKWRDLVDGNNGEPAWGSAPGLRPIYPVIMEQIIYYLGEAEDWVNTGNNRDRKVKFDGTATITNPFRGVQTVVRKPAACTGPVELLANQCIANKDKTGVDVHPRYTSKDCQKALDKCNLKPPRP